MDFDKEKCSYCCRLIYPNISFQCTSPQCFNAQNQPFLLCGDCFSAGVELHSHSNDHPFIVRKCLEVPLFTKDWTIREELELLKGITELGLGNWKAIAERISSKTIKQCEEHYWEVYMSRHGFCLPLLPSAPDDDTTSSSLPTASSSNTSRSGSNKHQLGNYIYSYADKSKIQELYEQYSSIRMVELTNTASTLINGNYERGQIVLRDDVITKLPLRNISTDGKANDEESDQLGNGNNEVNGIKEQLKDRPITSDLPGFIALREDFDIEFENDAERVLAEMEFNPDDHPSERALKLQLIDIYNRKLDERNKRKRFAIDWGLVDVKQLQQIDRRRTKEERELVAKLRVFARFMSSKEQFDALIEGILRARKLRLQLEIFRTYRKLGIRTLEQARDYEADRRSRERDLKAKKQREATPHLFMQTSSSQSSVTGRNDVINGTTSSSTSRRGSSSVSNRRRSNRGGGSIDENQNDTISEGDMIQNEMNTTINGNKRKLHDHLSSSTTAVAAVGAAVDHNEVINNIETNTSRIIKKLKTAPGGELLSEAELHLCSKVKFLPQHYLAAKDAIVREAYRNGKLTKEGIHRIFKLDEERCNHLADYFIKEAMINEQQEKQYFS